MIIMQCVEEATAWSYHMLGGESYAAERALDSLLHGNSEDHHYSKEGWRFLLKYQLRCFPESKYLQNVFINLLVSYYY